MSKSNYESKKPKTDLSQLNLPDFLKEDNLLQRIIDNDPELIFFKNIVKEKVKNFDYPVCFDFPVGHQRNNFALKCGMMHKLSVDQNEVSLKEI